MRPRLHPGACTRGPAPGRAPPPRAAPALPPRAAPAPRAARVAPAPHARSAACVALRRYTLADGGVVRAWLTLTLTLTLTRYTLADGGVVRAWLYLWHGHSRAVVFDVDGTIMPTSNP